MRRTVVIAEIGENHIGDMERARRMVTAAARAGADMVKFQSYRAADVAESDPEKEWFARVELRDDAHRQLRELAERAGVEFLSSAFSLERARFLRESLGLRKIKIASSELLNVGLLEYVNAHMETVFLSTGMATLEEIRQAVGHLGRVAQLCIMQCTTQYPCPPEEANLAVLTTLQQAFPGRAIGYSDHTIGNLAAIAAVALGATVIEKHFTLDKSLPGTDHVLSATPEELEDLVKAIRQVEVLLGSPTKAPTSSEAAIVEAVRSRFPKSSARDVRDAAAISTEPPG